MTAPERFLEAKRPLQETMYQYSAEILDDGYLEQLCIRSLDSCDNQYLLLYVHEARALMEFLKEIVPPINEGK